MPVVSQKNDGATDLAAGAGAAVGPPPGGFMPMPPSEGWTSESPRNSADPPPAPPQYYNSGQPPTIFNKQHAPYSTDPDSLRGQRVAQYSSMPQQNNGGQHFAPSYQYNSMPQQNSFHDSSSGDTTVYDTSVQGQPSKVVEPMAPKVADTIRKALFGANGFVFFFCLIVLGAKGWIKVEMGPNEPVVDYGLFAIHTTVNISVPNYNGFAVTAAKTVAVGDCPLQEGDCATNPHFDTETDHLKGAEGMQLMSFLFFLAAVVMGAKVIKDADNQEKNSLYLTGGLTLFAAFWQMVAFSLIASIHREQSDYFSDLKAQDLKSDVKDGPTSTLGYCFGLSVFSFLVSLVTSPLYMYLGFRKGAAGGQQGQGQQGQYQQGQGQQGQYQQRANDYQPPMGGMDGNTGYGPPMGT